MPDKHERTPSPHLHPQHPSTPDLVIQLPKHPPMLSPALARVLLRVLRKAAARSAPQELRARRASNRRYLLRGLVRCGLCGRRMEGSWNNGRAHYRCQLTTRADIDAQHHPRSIYVREDKIVTAVDGWLGTLFEPDLREQTIDQLHDAAQDPNQTAARQAARAAITHCDERLTKYRSALEAGVDATVVGGWIAEVQAQKLRHQATLNRLEGQPRLSANRSP
jgi:site-specific DNA recombinase